MGNFYSRLSYSFGNEDWNTEHRALKIKPQDHLLCVTASGDRPLNLMTADFQRMITVDANPLQNALFDLKRVALSRLPFSEYLAFIGAHPSKERKKTYDQLIDHLDPMVGALWELQASKIEKGVLFEGSVEKCLKMTSAIMKLMRGKKIETLFAIEDLEEQKEFVKKKWQTKLWKNALKIALHPLITRTFVKDPGLYEHIDPSFHVGNQIYERLNNYLNHNLAKESTLLSLLLKGSIDPRYFPPYLTEEGVAKIKKQVGKAQFYTADLISFVEKSAENSFDCFSISDVASYMDKEHFNRLLAGIFKCAKPNARFCIRQFLSNHQIPNHLTPYFQRDNALEKELKDEDRCFVYSFMTGTILKSN